jgi:hypothetical protein
MVGVVILGLAFPGVVLAADPTADALTPSTNEDTAVTVHLSADDADGDALTFSTSSTAPSHGTLGSIATAVCDGLVPNHCTADVLFTPDADYNGSDTFDYHANDGTNDSLDALVTVTIAAVNDAPSFDNQGDVVVAEDAGGQTYFGWASNPVVGPADESGQTYSYVVSSNNHPEYFSAGPAVATNGALTYTPAANKNGVATIGVKIQDSGSGTPPNVNQSSASTFTITITPVNDNPTPANDIRNVGENAPATLMHVLDNDNTNNPDGTETLTVFSVDTTGTTGTVTINGTNTDVTYQPPAGFQGSTTFKYTVHDPLGLAGIATVLVDVGPDTIAPVGTAPIEGIRPNVTMGTSTVIVRIGWSATDVGVGVTRYLLQRSTDGGAYATQTLPTPGTTAILQTLTVGHTYQYRMRPYDGAGNPGTLKYGPLFRVSRIEQTASTYVKFAGATWPTASNSSDSGGSARYSYTTNSTATLTLSGRDFAFVGPTNSFRGSAWVYVDGQFVGSISEHTSTSTTAYRRVLFQVHFATSGTHMVQIKVASGRIDVDCFIALR